MIILLRQHLLLLSALVVPVVMEKKVEHVSNANGIVLWGIDEALHDDSESRLPRITKFMGLKLTMIRNCTNL